MTVAVSTPRAPIWRQAARLARASGSLGAGGPFPLRPAGLPAGAEARPWRLTENDNPRNDGEPD